MYRVETWPVTVANMKRLEAAHHKWQWRILGVTWKDMITNDKIRKNGRTNKAGRNYAAKTAAMVGSPAQDAGRTYPMTPR